MTIHRFFIGPQFIDEEKGIILCQSRNLVKQVRKVLRLENGDRLDILDGQGSVYHCILDNYLTGGKRDFFQAKITGKEVTNQSADTSFTIAMPLIKTNRFEWALEKLTELGADKIVPIALSRTVIKTEEFSKQIRWRKIIEEAAEQCERSRTPELTAPLEFLAWLQQLEQNQNDSLRLICLERKTNKIIEEVLYNFNDRQSNHPFSCAIAIGAEGGFTEDEIEAAILHNFVPVSLGCHILRSETAALCALAISKSCLAYRNDQSCSGEVH
jgi:16S rRNA (uracil1498-N3)-methyltransferase